MDSSNGDGFTVSDLAAALSADEKADLVNALKNKLQDFADKHAIVLENLSPNVKKRVDTLREIQCKHDELEESFFKEQAELEAKYEKLYQPLYVKRYEIVNGVVEAEGVAQPQDKGIPNFWLITLKNNETLADVISERDEGALKFLKDIKWFSVDDPKGFKLEFCFDANPFFKNSVLTKTYHMIDEDEPIFEKSIGTEIDWYPEMKITEQIAKTERYESFFNFFSPPQIPGEDDVIDQDDVDKLHYVMELDYDIGSTIREKIIPNALYWFTGEAALEEYGDIEDDDDLDEDDSENDEHKDQDEDMKE